MRSRTFKRKNVEGKNEQTDGQMDGWMNFLITYYLPSAILVPSHTDVSRGKFPASTLLIDTDKTNIVYAHLW